MANGIKVAVLKTAAMPRQQKWDERNTAKEFKVVKLPRNGPRDGQSVGAWEAGKRRADIDWAKRKFDAISKGDL